MTAKDTGFHPQHTHGRAAGRVAAPLRSQMLYGDFLAGGEHVEEGMVERVARALFSTVSRDDLDEENANAQAYWRQAARAAIAAMREPTVVMLANGYLAWQSDQDLSLDEFPSLDHAWAAMCDAALAKPPK